MSVVHDRDRPDVGGVPPKMQDVCETTRRCLHGLAPYLAIKADDNLCSSVYIYGSHTPKDKWENGIYHNGLYFIISINPEKKKRYFEKGDTKVTIELSSACYKLTDKTGKMRKYTGSVGKAIDKIKKWIESYVPVPVP